VITIINVHSTALKGNQYIYCGCGSALGNPFVITKASDREKVCNQYKDWFMGQVLSKDNSAFNEQIEMILDKARKHEDIMLGCFCAPKKCHCETIKYFVESTIAHEK